MLCFGYVSNPNVNRNKFFISLNSKTSQKGTKKALAECLMVKTFLQEVMCIVSISLIPTGWF